MPSRMSAPFLAVVALVIGLAAAPAAQAAAAFDEVLNDYRDDAKIDPCKHSDQTLSDAAGQVPADIEQTAPDFPEALGNAIAARAQGACEGKEGGSGSKEGGGGSGGSKPAPSGGGKPAPSGGGSAGAASPAPTPASPPSGASNPPGANQAPVPTRPAASESDPPVPLSLLVILAGLLVLGGLLFAVRRWLGLDGHRIARARHTWGEAGFRAGGTWADFRDWLRVGR
ncbi:MAG: hypothetical protein ACR2ML_06025 [Solirubrobacteraceae bacterium]